MINFESIIKRSFNIVKKNRYLWFLGLLAGGASFGSNNINYLFNGSGSNGNLQKFKDLLPSSGTVATIVRAEVKDMGQVLGSSIGPSSVGNLGLWILLLIAAIVIVFALIYVSLVARGALIRSTFEIDSGEKIGLKKAWLLGHRLFWRRLSFEIIWFLIEFVPFVILSIPIIVLAIFEIKILAIILGIIFGLAYILYVIYLALIFPVAERELFLSGNSVAKSFVGGKNIFNKNWKNFVLTYLILFGFGIGLSIVLAIFLLVIGFSVAGIGFAFYLLAHWVGIAFWIILGLAVFAALLTISGSFNSFFSSILTLSYKDIKAKS